MGLFDSYEDMRRSTMSSIPKHIAGVRCDVKSCVYHDGDSYCTADRISVGTSFARNSAETACATFKPRASL